MQGRFTKLGLGRADEAPESEDAPAVDFPQVWETGSDGEVKIKIAITPQGFDKPDEFETTMSIGEDINKHVFIAYSHIFQSMNFEALHGSEGALIEVHNGVEWDHFKSVVTLGALVDDLIDHASFDGDAKDMLQAWERDLAKSLDKVRQALAGL